MKKIYTFFVASAISLPAFCGFVEGEKAFNQQHYSEAFSEFLPLANDGDFRSQYYVGYLYINGYGVTQDSKKGIEYLEMALDQNYDMAQALMGYLYSDGHVLPKDKKKALELYQKAAAQNNISANLNLGLMYYTGDGVPKNYKTALDYFQKVPVDQKPVVSRYLGSIYLNNASFRDYGKALYYYTLSAQQNDLSAYFSLGEIYRKGLGVSSNMSQAIEYYKYAASQNYPPAQYMLGIIYANGEDVRKDIYSAYAWLRIAADQNFALAQEALNKLTENMSINDIEKARKQVVAIQQGEMGKIPQPLKAEEVQSGIGGAETAGAAVAAATAKQSTSSSQRSSRRGVRRRRRR